MMKYTFIILITLLTLKVNAQPNIKEIQNEIDQVVWKPFQKAFQNLDAEALNTIYADKTLRVTPNGIDTKDDFKLANIERFATSKKNKVSIKLDFWFDSRQTNTDTSYEVGFYRISATVNNETNYTYGQFHIVLKKKDGIWKITQDWDTATINGNTISKTDFEKQAPLKF